MHKVLRHLAYFNISERYLVIRLYLITSERMHGLQCERALSMDAMSAAGTRRRAPSRRSSKR